MNHRLPLRLLLILAVAAFAASSQLQAAGLAVSSAKVTNIHLEGGQPYIFFDKAIGNPDGCQNNSRVVLSSDLTNREFYLSVAMTALATGKSVTAYVNGCVASHWGTTVPKIYVLAIAQ